MAEFVNRKNCENSNFVKEIISNRNVRREKGTVQEIKESVDFDYLRLLIELAPRFVHYQKFRNS